MADPQADKPRNPPGTRRSGEETSLSLLARARSNDGEAWRRIMSLYRPLVVAWCARGHVCAEDAEDVTQEVFAAAAAGLDGFRRDRPGDTFRGWLRGITRNLLLLHYRRTNGRPQAEGGSAARLRMENVADPLPEPEADDPAAVKQLYQSALEQVRGEFEDRTWQAFWLTAVEERTPAALAAELGMSAAAIRQAKSRVLRRLKRELGELLD